MNSSDIASFQKYICVLLQCARYEEVLTVCSKVNFGRLSEIYATFAKMLCEDFTWESFLKIVEEDCLDEDAQILSLDLRAEGYLRCSRYDEALKAAEASLILKEERFKADSNHSIPMPIFRILQIFVKAGNYQAGLKRLKVWEESYSFELNCSALFQSVAAVLYIANQQVKEADRAIQKINKIGVDPSVLADICFLLGMEILSINPESESKMALYYVNLALKFNPSHLKGQFYKLMSLILIGDKIAAQEMLKTMEPEAFLDISLAKKVLKLKEKDSDSEEQEDKLVIEDYDLLEIHKFFQAEKQHLLDKSIEALSRTPQPKAKWQIGSVSFEEGKEGLISVTHHNYFPCYAVIHPYLALDPSLRKKFQNALNKGTAQRKNTDGVQTLNNAVVQIAIREENRLYTTYVYRNENSQYLIVFDKQGNHKDVKQLARQRRPLDIILCANTEQSLQYIISPDSIFAVPQVNPPSEIISANAVTPSFTKK